MPFIENPLTHLRYKQYTILCYKHFDVDFLSRFLTTNAKIDACKNNMKNIRYGSAG